MTAKTQTGWRAKSRTSRQSRRAAWTMASYTGVINVDTQTPRHPVSVSGIVTDDHGRALLIRRRDNQRWEPPGGILELGEAIHDGLRREVREETGLDTEPIALTGVYKNMTRAIVNLVFRCKITGGALTTNDEASDSAG